MLWRMSLFRLMSPSSAHPVCCRLDMPAGPAGAAAAGGGQAGPQLAAELLLVETDAPFLTPHPFRGAPNESYCLPYTVRALADLLDRPAAELAEITTTNALRTYGIG